MAFVKSICKCHYKSILIENTPDKSELASQCYRLSSEVNVTKSGRQINHKPRILFSGFGFITNFIVYHYPCIIACNYYTRLNNLSIYIYIYIYVGQDILLGWRIADSRSNSNAVNDRDINPRSVSRTSSSSSTPKNVCADGMNFEDWERTVTNRATWRRLIYDCCRRFEAMRLVHFILKRVL